MKNTLQDILRVSAQFFGLPVPGPSAPADEAEAMLRPPYPFEQIGSMPFGAPFIRSQYRRAHCQVRWPMFASGPLEVRDIRRGNTVKGGIPTSPSAAGASWR